MHEYGKIYSEGRSDKNGQVYQIKNGRKTYFYFNSDVRRGITFKKVMSMT